MISCLFNNIKKKKKKLNKKKKFLLNKMSTMTPEEITEFYNFKTEKKFKTA